MPGSPPRGSEVPPRSPAAAFNPPRARLRPPGPGRGAGPGLGLSQAGARPGRPPHTHPKPEAPAPFHSSFTPTAAPSQSSQHHRSQPSFGFLFLFFLWPKILSEKSALLLLQRGCEKAGRWGSAVPIASEIIKTSPRTLKRRWEWLCLFCFICVCYLSRVLC